MIRRKLSKAAPGLLATAAIALLTGCGGGRAIPSEFWPRFQEYQTKGHYRAFVSTATAPSAGRAFTMSWGHASADEAIDSAMEGCRGYEEVSDYCRVHYLGDIDVSPLSDEEFERAKAVYTENPAATNDDL